MENIDFYKLTAKERALISIAVLLDGIDAGLYLDSDLQSGNLYKTLADEISKKAPDVRLSYSGTLLRRAIKDLKGQE